MSSSAGVPHSSVDIVTSRDLVRNFQRRLRTIVPIPLSHLAGDVNDQQQQHQRIPADYYHQHQQSSSKHQQQRTKKSPQKSLFGRTRDQHRRNKSPTISSSSSNANFFAGTTKNSNTTMRPPQQQKRPAVSLHDSLVAAIRADEKSRPSYSSSSSSPSRMSTMMNNYDNNDGSGGGSGDASSCFLSRESLRERKKDKLDHLYAQHHASLRTKWHPDPIVKRMRRETIPVILERDIATTMRNQSTTRCYYYDASVQNPDGSLIMMSVDEEQEEELEADDKKKQHQHQQKHRHSSKTDKSSAQLDTSRSSSCSDQYLLESIEGDSNENDPDYRHLWEILPKSPNPQKMPVPIQERPAWTFTAPPDPVAQELLERRKGAVTPPKQHALPILRKVDEKRVQCPPPRGCGRTLTEKTARHMRDAEQQNVAGQWEVCYSVE